MNMGKIKTNDVVVILEIRKIANECPKNTISDYDLGTIIENHWDEWYVTQHFSKNPRKELRIFWEPILKEEN